MKSSGAKPRSLKRSSFSSTTVWVAVSIRSTRQRTFEGSPSSCPAQAFKAGSAFARNEEVAAGKSDGPLKRVIKRYVKAVPVRGVVTTSSCGGETSPLAIESSVLAVQIGRAHV